VRLGLTPEIAEQQAERFVIAIEGAWIVARIRQSSEPFRVVAAMLARV
jgi:hypothetical protein